MKRRFFIKLASLLPFVGVKGLANIKPKKTFYLHQPLHCVFKWDYAEEYNDCNHTYHELKVLTGWQIGPYDYKTDKFEIEEQIGDGKKLFLGFILPRKVSLKELNEEWSEGYSSCKLDSSKLIKFYSQRHLCIK